MVMVRCNEDEYLIQPQNLLVESGKNIKAVLMKYLLK